MTQASTPNPIYYMRDEHTFKRLSDNVDTVLDEIRDEFSQGYSYGSLCSKRKNFKMIHAGGSDQLEPFLAECRTALTPQAMLTAAPPAAKAQQTHGLLLWATLDKALDAYWSAAYAEGQRGATHDTKDGRAQCALEAVRSCVRLAVAKRRKNMEWIPVADRLPEYETPVLIVRRGVVRFGERCWEDAYQSYWYWDDPRNDGQCWERDEITHWMALPALPLMESDIAGDKPPQVGLDCRKG